MSVVRISERASLALLPTARGRQCFHMRLFVHGGRVRYAWYQGPFRGRVSMVPGPFQGLGYPGVSYPDTLPLRVEVITTVGMHPTGMLSCVFNFFFDFFSAFARCEWTFT